MASMGKFIFFLLFLVSFSSIKIQARESKYFSKFMHYSTKESISDIPVEEPVSSPAPAPVESNDNGYGLYGHETGLFPPSKETPTTTTTTTTSSSVATTATELDENELLNQELDSYTYEKGYEGGDDKNNNNNNNNNNNGYYTNNYNNNNNNGYNNNNNNYEKNTYRLASASYVTGNQNNNGYTTYNKNNNNNNGYYTNNYNNNNGYQTNNYNNNNGYETERQGMSDTRFMENGKYYYDVGNENNHYPTTGYESEMTNTKYSNEEEYETQVDYEGSQNESELP